MKLRALLKGLGAEWGTVLVKELRQRDEAIAELRAEVEVLRGHKNGAWKANKHYAIGDVVTWNARSWRCVTQHRSTSPDTDRAYWERV